MGEKVETRVRLSCAVDMQCMVSYVKWYRAMTNGETRVGLRSFSCHFYRQRCSDQKGSVQTPPIHPGDGGNDTKAQKYLLAQKIFIECERVRVRGVPVRGGERAGGDPRLGGAAH